MQPGLRFRTSPLSAMKTGITRPYRYLRNYAFALGGLVGRRGAGSSRPWPLTDG